MIEFSIQSLKDKITEVLVYEKLSIVNLIILLKILNKFNMISNFVDITLKLMLTKLY